MNDIEAILRHAIENHVTTIMIDTSGSMSSVGCWKAFSGYHIVYHSDPIEALQLSIAKALAPPPKKKTDLSDLLS